VIAAALALLIQEEAVLLKYGGDRGVSQPMAAELTLDLELKGTDNALNFIRSVSPFFSFSKIKYKADGERRIDRVDRRTELRTLRTQYAQARVEGVYDDEKFGFDFDLKAPPADMKDDKLKGLLWVIVMNGHPQTLSPAGVLKAVDLTQDAFGEALMHLSWPTVRLSDKPVKEGESWDTKWRGDRKDKQNGSQFDFVQKAKLEKLADSRAEVSLELAAIASVGKDATGKQETKVEGKAKVVLDLKTGQPASWEGSGTVRAVLKGTDPTTGEDTELQVTFSVATKQGAKE